MAISSRVHVQLLAVYLIISVHRTASWSSISLSLYWFLSISTRAISTLVKRFLCAVGTSFCAIKPTHRRREVHVLGQGSQWRLERTHVVCAVHELRPVRVCNTNTHIFFIFAFVFHFLYLETDSGERPFTVYLLCSVVFFCFAFFLAIHNEDKKLTRADCWLTFWVPPPALCSCPPAWFWPAAPPPAPPATSPSHRSTRPPSISSLCSPHSERSWTDGSKQQGHVSIWVKHWN